MKEQCLETITYFGLENQLKKLNEEVYELCEAILLDVGDEESLDHIEEEFADVEFLLKQIFYKLDLNRRRIDNKMILKSIRTNERMKTGYYKK